MIRGEHPWEAAVLEQELTKARKFSFCDSRDTYNGYNLSPIYEPKDISKPLVGGRRKLFGIGRQRRSSCDEYHRHFHQADQRRSWMDTLASNGWVVDFR